MDNDLDALERRATAVHSLDALLDLVPAQLPPTGCWEIAAPNVTPAAAFAATGHGSHRLLLESTLPGGPLGSYSFLTGDPLILIWHRAGYTFLADPRSGVAAKLEGNPFDIVQALLHRYSSPDFSSLPTPFPAGLAGYFGYELRHQIEQSDPGPPDDIGLPELLLGLYNSTLTFDHTRGTIIVSGPSDGTELTGWRKVVSAAQGVELAPSAVEPYSGAIVQSMPWPRYEPAARRVLDHIFGGDIYQANLTGRFQLDFSGDAWDLYLRLRESNPAPFAAFMQWPGVAVVSASPERFLWVDGRAVVTRPIKGTRPRGATAAEDLHLRDELEASPKDRAENVMIVDLLRNDLGRVCEIGSVHVPELLAVESYATVHHLVSTVAGRLAEGRDMVDLLRACWPGGSITGAPKIRAMEIIAEVEPVARGVYCGSIGYLGFGGRMDSSIVIRTAVIANGRAYVNAGGGIVADSDPAAEYQESIDKAAALLRALGVAPERLQRQVAPEVATT